MSAGQSISVEEHLERILSEIDPLPPQPVELDQATGRVLTEAVTAAVDIPSFDNSSMDGYAVRYADVQTATAEHPVVLTVVADLAAGTILNPPIDTGMAARIMTGAPIPVGADGVVPIEETDLGTDRVVIRRAPFPGAYIRRIGSDTRAGEPVLAAGVRLTARHIAAAAASGRDALTVHPAPRIGVLSTGSELVDPGRDLRRGQIHDSNSYLLAAAVREAGGVPVRIGSVPDDESRFREVLHAHAGDVDAFLLSGGVSVGAYDVVKAVLSTLGTVRFDSVRMQPGKPQAFGHWTDGTPIFALPGNPVSAFVSFEVFVRPALLKMQGLPVLTRPVTEAIATVDWPCPPGRRQYMPVSVEQASSGQLQVRPASTGGSGSHLVAGLAGADAVAVIDENAGSVRAGDRVTVMVMES